MRFVSEGAGLKMMAAGSLFGVYAYRLWQLDRRFVIESLLVVAVLGLFYRMIFGRRD